MPLMVFALTLVPSCDTDCTYSHLLQLAQNILTFLIEISIPIAVIVFAVAGFMYMTAGGDESKIKSAHKIFRNTIVGFIIVLAAWLIVYAITEPLLKEGILTDPT